MARPTKAIKRQEKLSLNYTKAEFKMIEKCAVRHGISKAKFARHKSLNNKLKSRFTQQKVDLYMKKVGISNNLIQLTKIANQAEVFKAKILKTLEAINFSTDS